MEGCSEWINYTHNTSPVAIVCLHIIAREGRYVCSSMIQKSATHCNTAWPIATRCNTALPIATTGMTRGCLRLRVCPFHSWICCTLQCIATRYNTVQRSATHCNAVGVYEVKCVLFSFINLLHCATCCNVLQRIATLHNALQRITMHCNALQHSTTHCNVLQHIAAHFNASQRSATHCNTAQHIATYCSTMQHITTHCDEAQHIATHCNTAQRIATHCNTQRRWRGMSMCWCTHLG